MFCFLKKQTGEENLPHETHKIFVKKALGYNKFLIGPRQEHKMSRRSHLKRLALNEPA